jgi:hypothetical protein
MIEGKIKGEIEVPGRRGRCRKLLDDQGKERILTPEAGSSVSHHGRGFRPVVRQAATK